MTQSKPSKWALEKSNEFLYNMRCGYPMDDVKKMIHNLALKFDAIRRERDEVAEKLMEALEWAAVYIADGLSRPKHACEYQSNPEKGACDFCEHWADVQMQIAAYSERMGR